MPTMTQPKLPLVPPLDETVADWNLMFDAVVERLHRCVAGAEVPHEVLQDCVQALSSLRRAIDGERARRGLAEPAAADQQHRVARLGFPELSTAWRTRRWVTPVEPAPAVAYRLDRYSAAAAISSSVSFSATLRICRPRSLLRVPALKLRIWRTM
jgi:hypothetical protein